MASTHPPPHTPAPGGSAIAALTPAVPFPSALAAAAVAAIPASAATSLLTTPASALVSASTANQNPQLFDYALMLEDFIPTIENVPSEIKFYLEELFAKDIEFTSLRENILTNDMALRRLIRNTPIPSQGQSQTTGEANTNAGNGDAQKDSDVLRSGVTGNSDSVMESSTTNDSAVDQSLSQSVPSSQPKKPESSMSVPGSPSKNAKASTSGSSHSKSASGSFKRDHASTDDEKTTEKPESGPYAASKTSDLAGDAMDSSAGSDNNSSQKPKSDNRSRPASPSKRNTPHSQNDTSNANQQESDAQDANTGLDAAIKNEFKTNGPDASADLHPDVAMFHRLQTLNHTNLSEIPEQYHLYSLIQQDYMTSKQIADEKVVIAEQMKEMLERHIQRLNAEMEKIDEGGMEGAGTTGTQSWMGSMSTSTSFGGYGSPMAQTTTTSLSYSSRHMDSGTGTVMRSMSAMSSLGGAASFTPATRTQQQYAGSTLVGSSATAHGSTAATAAPSRPSSSLSSAIGAPSTPLMGRGGVSGASRAGSSVSVVSVGGLESGVKHRRESVSGHVSGGAVDGGTVVAASAGTGGTWTGVGAHKRKVSTTRSVAQKKGQRRKTDSPSGLMGGVLGMGEGLGGGVLDGGMMGGGPEASETDENIYCVCQQMSYGQMIACDNAECPREWFHLDCVGLREPPTGVWFCQECLQSQRVQRRGRQ